MCHFDLYEVSFRSGDNVASDRKQKSSLKTCHIVKYAWFIGDRTVSRQIDM